ncbi:MAG TPA: TolC family protein [Dissulfurispiraceae bacterium]
MIMREERHSTHLLTLIFLFFFLLSGRGEALSTERRLTFVEAVELALENNHEIKAFKNSLAGRQEDIGIAWSYLLPELSFEERFMRTDNPTYAFTAKLNQERFASSDFAINSFNNPKAINDFQTSLSFEQLVFAKKANIGVRRAKAEYAAQNKDYRRKREEIAVKVAHTYLSVLTAKEYVRVDGEALKDSREHLRIADLRYKNGLGLFSDTLRASTAVTEAEQKLVSAQKKLNVAKRALGLLLGTSESVDTADGQMEIPLMDIDYYTDASLERSDIKSLEARRESARTLVKLADAGYLPTIGIGGLYQLNDHRAPFGSEGDSWRLTAFLRWELFDGMKREHERAKAKYREAEAEERLKGLKTAVSFKVYEAYLNVNETRKNAELAASVLKTSEEGRRLVRLQYENSLSPIVDLLDAQISLDNARASQVAKGNEYRTAIADLAYESGTILKDLLIEEEMP